MLRRAGQTILSVRVPATFCGALRVGGPTLSCIALPRMRIRAIIRVSRGYSSLANHIVIFDVEKKGSTHEYPTRSDQTECVYVCIALVAGKYDVTPPERGDGGGSGGYDWREAFSVPNFLRKYYFTHIFKLVCVSFF